MFHGESAYVVGEQGTILRWTGSVWQAEESGTSEDLTAVWGADSGEVFVVGASGTALRRGQTTTWESLSTGTSSYLQGVWGVSSSEVYAVGINAFRHFDGTSWRAEPNAPAGTNWVDIAGDGEHLVAVGSYGTIGQRQQGEWSFGEPTRLTSPINAITDIWTDGTVVFAADAGGVILQRVGAVWEVMTTLVGFHPNAMWGSSATQVFIVGRDGKVFRFDGAQWAEENIGTTSSLHSVHGCAPDDVYIGGADGIWHFDGSSWTQIRSDPLAVYALQCVDGELFAGLWGGDILHRMGTNWLVEETMGTSVWGLWASSVTDVWAVGHEGQVLHRTGGGWQRVSMPGSETWFSDVAGTGPDDVTVVGPMGAIYHYDGVAFSRQGPVTVQTLRVVAATPSGAVFAAGDNGMILHRTP
ncbi:MAG: hypothetical protein JRH20_31745 [Deltaproteobacteria bacterium]|nr:hypothetical protein [Deltaproteobacteria bacterium]